MSDPASGEEPVDGSTGTGNRARRPDGGVIDRANHPDRVGPTEQPTRSLSPLVRGLGHALYYGAIAVGLTLLVGPILVVTLVSFNPTTTEAFPPTGFSLRWYAAFLGHETFMQDFFLVSLPIAAVSAILATGLGVAAAYVLVRYDLPYQNVIQSLLTAPLMIPGVIIGFSLMLVFSEVNLQSGYLKIILGHSVRVLPYTVLTTMASLYSLDPELERAARNLGASKLRTFREVTLPLMKSGVIAGFLLAFIISFADINVALFLTSPKVTTLPVEMFLFLQWESSPLIAAISVAQIGVVLVLVVVIQRLVGFETVFEQ